MIRRRVILRLRSTGSGAYVVTGNCQTLSRHRSVSGSDWTNVVSIRIPRHTETTSHDIVFGSMNVASLSPSKLGCADDSLMWPGDVRPPAAGGVAAVGVPDPMRSGQASVRRRRTARRLQRQVGLQCTVKLYTDS